MDSPRQPDDPSAQWPSRLDAALGNWRFSLNLNTGKVEVCRAHRPDLAHLTIAWGTESQTLDIHLTHGHEQAGATGGDKDWRPLFRIPLAVVEAHGGAGNEVVRQTLVPRLLGNYKKYRPGWLAAHGYVINAMDREPAWRWFGTALAPKKRGKFRLRPEALLHPEHFPREIVASYDPRVLHLDALQVGGAHVQAARVHGGRLEAPEGITLSYTLGPDGTVGWWGIKNKHLLSVMRTGISMFVDWLTPRLTHEDAAKCEQIIVSLGLEEDEGTRTFARAMRRLLVEGRNPVRQPYPRTRTDAPCRRLAPAGDDPVLLPRGK